MHAGGLLPGDGPVRFETTLIRQAAFDATASESPVMPHRRKALLAVIMCTLCPAVAGAEEGPFVWNANGSAEDLGIRTGVALDMPGRPRLGAESNLRLSTRADSGTVHPPVRLWGEIDVHKTQAGPTSLGLTVDLRGSAARASLRQSRAVLDSGVATFSLSRALEAGRRSDGQQAFVARQDLRLAFNEIDTMVTGGIVMDNKAPFRADLGLEKRIFEGFSLKATLSDLAHAPAARVNARFERSW